MKCKGCHAEFEDNGKLYCTECSIKRKKYRSVLNIILPIAFIILMGLGIKLAFFTGGPDRVINDFLSTLKSRDYVKAYSFLDETKLKSNQLLTLKDFEASFSGREVSSYKITVKNTKYNASDEIVEYDVLIYQGLEHSEVKMQVVKALVNNRTNWRIDPLYLCSQTTINTLGALTLKVNGQTLPPSEDGDYDIMMFKNIPADIMLTNEDIIPLEHMGISGETFTLLNVEPSASIKNGAMETIRNFKTALNETLKDYSLSHIEPYISNNSGKWQTLEGYIEYIKSKNEKPSENLLDLQFKSIYFDKGTGKYSLSKILVTTEEKSQQADGKQKNASWVYELEKQADSNWLITNYYLKD